MLVRIGCSGYYYRGWAGRWYPKGLSARRRFVWYAEHFDTVEINASFYRFPTGSAVSRWIKQAPVGFIYSIKAPRIITHRKRFHDCARQIADFYEVLAPLSDRLGCLLFQMPPTFPFSEENLGRILVGLRPGFRNVVEFRHASWWKQKVYQALERAGAIFCSVHAPRLPDEVIVCNGFAYLRFHGDPWYRHDYSDKELAEWTARLRISGAKIIWIYFNNDAGAAAPRNARRLRTLLAESG